MESTTDLENKVAHYREAYHHCRRSVNLLRPQVEIATELALRKDRQRRLLARELAAANLKVRILAASVEEFRKVAESATAALAAMRSECSGIGL